MSLIHSEIYLHEIQGRCDAVLDALRFFCRDFVYVRRGNLFERVYVNDPVRVGAGFDPQAIDEGAFAVLDASSYAK